jgi:hypothetical protein
VLRVVIVVFRPVRGITFRAECLARFEKVKRPANDRHLLLGCRGPTAFSRLPYFKCMFAISPSAGINHQCRTGVRGSVRRCCTTHPGLWVCMRSYLKSLIFVCSCRHTEFFGIPVAHALLLGLVKDFWRLILRPVTDASVPADKGGHLIVPTAARHKMSEKLNGITSVTPVTRALPDIY